MEVSKQSVIGCIALNWCMDAAVVVLRVQVFVLLYRDCTVHLITVRVYHHQCCGTVANTQNNTILHVRH